MADVITRFKLETTQYDSKLRDAAKSLSAYSKQAELAGKEFDKFTKSGIEAAKAFGAIESGATNTKDKLKDLVGAYNDVARAYNNLTEQQRQSDFGKAMAQSLSQLQDRIKETKDELYSLGEVAKSSGGLFGEGGMTGMLQVAGGNLLSKGVSMLAGELKDAWAESVKLAKEGEGVRLAFQRLNQPGLLDKLKEATHGTVNEVELMKQAIKFDNFKLPLEDLATYLAFAQQKAKDTGESVDYMVNSITTGLGRQSKQILDNLGISAAELTKRMAEGKDMTQAVAEIIREEMAKAGDYVETAADRAAQATAKATDEMEKFGQSAAPIAEAFNSLWADIKNGALGVANVLLGPVAESILSIQRILGTTLDDRRIQMFEKLDKIAKQQQAQSGYKGMGSLQSVTAPGGYVEVTDPNTGAVIGGQHFDNLKDANGINSWKKGLFKTSKSGSGSKKSPITMSNFQTTMAKAAMGADKLKPSDYIEQPSVWKQYAEGIKGTFESIEDPMSNLKEWTKDFDPFKQKMDDLAKAAQVHKQAMSLAGQATEGFGAALQSIGDPAAKAAGVVVSAIANIVMGFSMASAQAAAVGVGWGWLAWIGAGLAALTTTISTVHNLTGYAEGGMVNGSTYSGDQIPIMANAGEVVLTKAQQGNLASQLQGGGLQNLKLDGVITGENIHIVHNRYLSRTGQGELVTW